MSRATVLKECLRFNSNMIYMHLHKKNYFGFMHPHLPSIVLAAIFAIWPPDKTLHTQAALATTMKNFV